MLFVISQNRHVRARLKWLLSMHECSFFASFSCAYEQIKARRDHFSVLIDEQFRSGDAASFCLDCSRLDTLDSLFLVAGEQAGGDTGCTRSDIRIIRRENMDRELALLLGGRQTVPSSDDFGLTGSSQQIKDLRAQISLIGSTGCNVIIDGESGSGKEAVASALHKVRSKGDAVAVNCALLSGPLFESKMFGHSDSAYSGAQRAEAGYADAACGSTMILDEVEDLDPLVQAMMLRFIETGEYRRLGEKDLRYAKCRFIAITNVDVQELIRQNRLRKNFYMRIAGAKIHVPPLRQHKEDIEELVRKRERDKGFASEIKDIEALMKYDWPGNVRELFNCVDRLHMLQKEDTSLAPEDIRDEDFL